MAKRSPHPTKRSSSLRRVRPSRHREIATDPKNDRIDIDALHSALLSFTLLSAKLAARQRRPVKEWTRSDLAEFFKELDRDLRVAVATLASELGFSVCQCCWPPEVLATDLAGKITSLAGSASSDQNVVIRAAGDIRKLPRSA